MTTTKHEACTVSGIVDMSFGPMPNTFGLTAAGALKSLLGLNEAAARFPPRNTEPGVTSRTLSGLQPKLDLQITSLEGNSSMSELWVADLLQAIEHDFGWEVVSDSDEVVIRQKQIGGVDYLWGHTELCSIQAPHVFQVKILVCYVVVVHVLIDLFVAIDSSQPLER